MRFFARLARTKRAAIVLAKADDGAIFTLALATLGYTAIALGVWGTGEAINNKLTVNDATAQMRQQADEIRQRTEGDDSAQAQQMQQNADLMTQAADKMDSQENWNVGIAVASNLADAGTAGITSKSKGVYQAVKVVWDGYTGTQIGQNALNLVQDQKPEVDEGIAILQQVQWDKGGATAADGSQPDYEKDSPVDGFIFQTKANVMSGEVSAIYPDADPEFVMDLTNSLVLDAQIDQISDPASEVTISDSNPFLDSGIADMTTLIDPNNPQDVEMGQVRLDPDDQAAFEDGEKTFVIGQYFGANGLEPVIVSGDPTKPETEFTLLPDQPVVETDSDYKTVIEDMPDWWDGSVDSCPFLFAWDGDSFVPVNDIISVSRDPEREYDDYMLFESLPRMSGSYEVRVTEIRDEESWLDALAFFAVDVPDGYGAAVTPAGDVLSTGRLMAADRAWGTSPAVLGRVDGTAVRIYDGQGPEALWNDVGSDAVLLVSMDGFEDDGDPGALLFKRPTLFVEAWDGDAWVAAGAVKPRAQTDTVAVDLSAFVVDGEVRVRLSSDSCNVGKYQLLDRLVLSTADRSLADVTEVSIESAVMGGVDVADRLGTTDDVRVHTVPGDSIAVRFAAEQADCFVVMSRGWYRPLP